MSDDAAHFVARLVWLVIFVGATGFGAWYRYRPTRAQRDFDKLAKQCIQGLKTQLGAPDAIHDLYDKQYKKWASVEAVWSSGSIELQLNGKEFDVSAKPAGGKAVSLAQRYGDRLTNSVHDPNSLRELAAMGVQVLRGELASA